MLDRSEARNQPILQQISPTLVHLIVQILIIKQGVALLARISVHHLRLVVTYAKDDVMEIELKIMFQISLYNPITILHVVSYVHMLVGAQIYRYSQNVVLLDLFSNSHLLLSLHLLLIVILRLEYLSFPILKGQT